MSEQVCLSPAEAEQLAARACLGTGADEATTRSLVKATLSAAMFGQPIVGFPHFIDYLGSLRDGRINRTPSPRLHRAYPAFLECDADGGIAQLGFDLAFPDLTEAARSFGLAAFGQRNSYTTGELGYYVRRLADEGLVAIAATNANAVVAPAPGKQAVYGTNPIAFGFPLGGACRPIVIDQATSATAFVNIVAAAEDGRSIPEGWALDGSGQATQDPAQALTGALLPFGGRKGANLALMVELLSAGLSGGNWSLDVPDFRSGSKSPGVGLTVIAVMPGSAAETVIQRTRDQSVRLEEQGVHVPGVSSAGFDLANGTVNMRRDVYEAISRFAGAGKPKTAFAH